jgi:hypothetical protein
MSLPHFLFGQHTYLSVNDRFALTFDPKTAYTGMGWGFSFFGEAYLVGGYPMVIVATLSVMIFFRWLYIRGGRDERRGVIGAVSLAAIPFAFWFQRNALAYFVKEFLILQAGTIFMAYYSIKLLFKQSRFSRPNASVAGGKSLRIFAAEQRVHL